MIGKKLIELRKRKKMTQKAVADKIRVSRSTYSNYESEFREPDFNNVEMLADLFEVSVDYLLGREVTEEQKKTNYVIDELVKKYNLNLSIPGEREKLEVILKLYLELGKTITHIL